jgi:hypothetical protein
MHRLTVRRLLPAAGALLLAACTDAPTAAEPAVRTSTTLAAARGGDRLATIEFEGRSPALFIQDAEGKNRFRVRFVGVHDRVEGNYPRRFLEVSDSTIRALGPAKWSPDGRQLAVVVTIGFDQSQVVVMNADGHNIRVASPNSQIILGDVDWSADSRYVAYAMSTLPNAQGVDLFVTELATSAVSRLTSEGRTNVFDEYRFDDRNGGLWLTQFEGWSEDGMHRVARVYHVALDGTKTGVDAKLVGDPQGISRDGRWALAMRQVKDGNGVRELVRQPLGEGEELSLVSGNLMYAELLENDAEAVVVSVDANWTPAFEVFGLDAARDYRGTLPVAPYAASMAFFRGSTR